MVVVVVDDDVGWERLLPVVGGGVEDLVGEPQQHGLHGAAAGALRQRHRGQRRHADAADPVGAQQHRAGGRGLQPAAHGGVPVRARVAGVQDRGVQGGDRGGSGRRRVGGAPRAPVHGRRARQLHRPHAVAPVRVHGGQRRHRRGRRGVPRRAHRRPQHDALHADPDAHRHARRPRRGAPDPPPHRRRRRAQRAAAGARHALRGAGREAGQLRAVPQHVHGLPGGAHLAGRRAHVPRRPAPGAAARLRRRRGAGRELPHAPPHRPGRDGRLGQPDDGAAAGVPPYHAPQISPGARPDAGGGGGRGRRLHRGRRGGAAACGVQLPVDPVRRRGHVPPQGERAAAVVRGGGGVEGGERAGAGRGGEGGAAGGQGEVGPADARRRVPRGGVRRGGRRRGEGDAERPRGRVGDEAGGRRPRAHVEGAQRRVRLGMGAVLISSGRRARGRHAACVRPATR